MSSFGVADYDCDDYDQIYEVLYEGECSVGVSCAVWQRWHGWSAEVVRRRADAIFGQASV